MENDNTRSQQIQARDYRIKILMYVRGVQAKINKLGTTNTPKRDLPEDRFYKMENTCRHKSTELYLAGLDVSEVQISTAVKCHLSSALKGKR